MPKSADGKIGEAAVRYVLHRLFVEKHGWYVRGLAPAGETWNSSSPAAMLQDTAAHAIFEDHLGNHTSGLHEVAVLAATLENLVHGETVERLRSAFKAHGAAAEGATLTESQLEEVVDTYMMLYVMGEHSPSSPLHEARKLIAEVYPSWHETARFVREVRREVLDRSDADSSKLGFSDAMEVVEEIGERYGRWQNRECLQLKHDLVKLESQGTGRVLLKEFYGAAAGGAWQFSESVGYMRQLGALDESDPARPKVIIPNYINAPSNCVASSSFYSVCCIDECESLLGQLERTLAAPEATPGRIAEVIAALPSATVTAPRDLPESLRRYLDDIARHHGGGNVPLHGRLFAQLMHHAYPRECGFPHVAGTTRPQTTSECEGEHGEGSCIATEEEMRQHMESAAPHKEEGGLPWVAEEELFAAHSPGTPTGGGRLGSAGRAMAFAAASLSVLAILARGAAPSTAGKSTDPNKFYV